MSVNVAFAGNSLQTSSILTSNITVSDIPTKQAQLYPIAHGNLSRIPFVNYPSRTIKIDGKLIGGSVAGMDALLDTFKSYLTGQDQNLDIDWNGSTRRFTATVNSTTITRPNQLGWANFVVEFVCTNPFGQDTSTTTALSASGRTLGSYSDAYTFLGTAPYQYPITTVTLTAVTGGTSASMIIGNAGNGQAITVNRTWAAADVLVIDGTQKTVTVNGLPVNFTGAFPEFPPGAQTISYTDTFATRTFTISVVYTKEYL